MKIKDIIIDGRHRKDMGDIQGLAESIKRVGLLHPVVVTNDGKLIAGERRIKAFELLGIEDIPVTVIDLKEIVQGEYQENIQRKDFLPSEAVAIAREVRPKEQEEAKERELAGKPSATFAEGETRQKVAKYVGVSHTTLAKAETVVEAAEKEPEKYESIVQQMDKSNNINAAYKAVKRVRDEDERVKGREIGADAIHKLDGRFLLLNNNVKDMFNKVKESSIDCIVTDPPYSKEYLSCLKSLGSFAALVLKPGKSMLVMVGQLYLPTVLNTLCLEMNYHWTLAYLTPGGQSPQIWNRKVNTFWKPVIWLTKGELEGRDWYGDVFKSDINDNDKRFHHWGQSESGIGRLVEAFTKPDDLVCDPFVGGGTTAVVSINLGRKFIGSDIDADALETCRTRVIKSYE
ncbi:MAG: DNA methyltransferase [Chloroflexota bacterium]